ncbi:hypothetical protein HOK51_10760 [Candidatus Woesearchaeota archaeon]|jgi:large subunit ribosomal protein L32e|nr:hypothetical protein [Candidatus Woesearchaeota archaeon]MBT6520302.1 hypothetical protein [Candidatus Woesearchaeota archaeon]MBT7368254.1 hypothetical protein [Candidatus Woesearchaeota archaeon]
MTETKQSKKTLLEVRNSLKKKKPNFLRQDGHKKARLSKKWVKPRGLQSKMRLKRKGYRRCVSVGWRSPVLIRGLSRDGLNLVKVSTVAEVESLNPKEDKAIICGSVGRKKRLDLIKKAIERELLIHDYKDPKKFIEETELEIKKKKEEGTKKKSDRAGKQEKDKKEAEKKKKEEEEKAKKESEDKKSDAESLEANQEKKEEEKKEKDKVLISKN